MLYVCAKAAVHLCSLHTACNRLAVIQFLTSHVFAAAEFHQDERELMEEPELEESSEVCCLHFLALGLKLTMMCDHVQDCSGAINK